MSSAVGLGELGHEWIMSYSALLAEEKQETYKLPVSLGIFRLHPHVQRRSDIDEVTLITSVIHCAENSESFNPKPHVSSRDFCTLCSHLRNFCVALIAAGSSCYYP